MFNHETSSKYAAASNCNTWLMKIIFLLRQIRGSVQVNWSIIYLIYLFAFYCALANAIPFAVMTPKFLSTVHYIHEVLVISYFKWLGYKIFA